MKKIANMPQIHKYLIKVQILREQTSIYIEEFYTSSRLQLNSNIVYRYLLTIPALTYFENGVALSMSI